MSYVLVYYDIFFWYPPTPPFIFKGGRVTMKVRVGYLNEPDLDSISICLIYNVYLLLHLGPRALTS
jgi:hypothetical protein